jgi:hypothetical protein
MHVTIELDPASRMDVRLASGRTATEAHDVGWRVLAVWSRLPSGRPLVEHLSVSTWRGPYRAAPGDLLTGMVIEGARRAFVRLIDPTL